MGNWNQSVPFLVPPLKDRKSGPMDWVWYGLMPAQRGKGVSFEMPGLGCNKSFTWKIKICIQKKANKWWAMCFVMQPSVFHDDRLWWLTNLSNSESLFIIPFFPVFRRCFALHSVELSHHFSCWLLPTKNLRNKFCKNMGKTFLWVPEYCASTSTVVVSEPIGAIGSCGFATGSGSCGTPPREVKCLASDFWFR